MTTAAPLDMKTAEWKIKVARNAITSCWAELAASGLSSDQRREIRDRLRKHLNTLRQLRDDQKQPPTVARTLGIDAVKTALG